MSASVLLSRRTRLIGREADLEHLRERLLHGDGRLVTLTGVGGVGKTSLAREVARMMVPSMTDGAWFVDLATVLAADDPAPIVEACCLALGLVDQSRPQAEVMTDHLAPRQALLILDNCEHVRVGTSRVVDQLLDGCPYLLILATSRVPLKVRGETLIPVSPLPLPVADARADPQTLAAVPSVELFAQRGRAANPRFRLDEANATAVAGICRRLDGIPLAIELAAAHVGALSPADIEKRLGQEAGLLQTDDVGTPVRQQTLEQTLDWSYRLLSEDQQSLFRRLSVFVGGWTVQAVEAVCALGGDASQLAASLGSLVEQSLVIRGADDSSRYRFLQPIAEFAGRRLDESGGERHALAMSHARYFLAVAGHRDPGAMQASPSDLDIIEADHDNCLAALRFAERARIAPLALGLAGALAGYWRVRGHMHTGAQHLETAVDLAGPEPSIGRGVALVVLADYERLLRRYDDAKSHAGEAIGMADELGDVAAKRTAIAVLGDVAAAQGDYRTAVAEYERAWPLVTARPNPISIGFWHANLGMIELRQGLLEKAERHLEEALVTLRQTEQTWYLGRVLASLGAVQRRRGKPGPARDHLREGFDQLLRYGARVDAIGCLEELGRVALDQRDPVQSATLLAAASTLRDATAIVPDDAERIGLGSDIDRCREAQSLASFNASWARGRAMSFEEAARFAGDTETAPAKRRRPPRGSQLTRREREVAQLVARGMTNPQIAERLFISPGTVRGHVEQILGKLGLTSRVQIATWAVGEPSGGD